jgi:hypothetical protein
VTLSARQIDGSGAAVSRVIPEHIATVDANGCACSADRGGESSLPTVFDDHLLIDVLSDNHDEWLRGEMKHWRSTSQMLGITEPRAPHTEVQEPARSGRAAPHVRP